MLPSDLPVAPEDDSGFYRNEIARLGQDLAFVHRGGDDLRRRSRPLPSSAGWWIALAAPAALLGAWLGQRIQRFDQHGRRLIVRRHVDGNHRQF